VAKQLNTPYVKATQLNGEVTVDLVPVLVFVFLLYLSVQTSQTPSTKWQAHARRFILYFNKMSAQLTSAMARNIF